MHRFVARFFMMKGLDELGTARRRDRRRGVLPIVAIGILPLLLSSCSIIDALLPPVRWTDSNVRLALYLMMSPIPDAFEDEAEAGMVPAFTGTVETGGSFTIDADLQCEFSLGADADFSLDLLLGTYLEGFSGGYDAAGEGFNNPSTCTYETYALYEWVIEFEVLESVTMQLAASLRASVLPAVVGQSLHYILVREKGAPAPIWRGDSEEDEADVDFAETLDLPPGTYEFAVYARPLLQGTSGVASLSSGWDYAITFDGGIP